jgi:isoleucyl-tRNA synthetase
MAKDYKDTLNLPQTDFPMRASLPQREPEQIERWLKDRIYYRLVEKNRKHGGNGRYLLHDGPPYANGNIHVGHALNKVLKDVIVKFKAMTGHETPYVPGWDCHGLPIELGVEKQLLEQKRERSSVPVTEFRELCRAYATKYIDLQRSQFQRLEVFGDWDKPYTTMSKEYVASIVRELGRHSKAGVLYKGNKPVYWCPTDATALAEAEIEYADKTSPSIYVKFDLPQAELDKFPALAGVAKRESAQRVSLVIWTTTPWTLPANLGISLHPEFDYVALKAPALEGTELWIVAEGLVESFSTATGTGKPEPVLKFKADKLHKLKARHPFIERDSLIMLGDHVTLEAGTGAVHTAPGHGVEDYKIGARYGLEIFAPVDQYGKFTDGFAPMKGQFVFKANEAIIELLKESGHLVARQDIKHSYPHCWRCHKAVLFRATPQWFIGMGDNEKGGLRKRSLASIGEVAWVPSWGINRITSMVESRPDWCISRQRAWGVPITVFYCDSCGEPKADPATFNHVADEIMERGVDVWFTDPAEKLLPPGAKCAKCAGAKFSKERDILDVWFDSGVSHAAVCEERELGWPADLYLEGSDQHRGWFQTSLLTAVATRGRAPFKTVLTHGFVNDKDGKAMSKSKGNVVSPLDVMKTHGAEILRLWVCLEDYRNDVSFSNESLERVSESYRKIRNTVRFLLGNLHDFKPDEHRVALSELGELDRWALSWTQGVLDRVRDAYEKFEFHRVYQEVVNFCVVDLSALYLDILKDRLYTAGRDSKERRSSQTALWLIASSLLRAVTPILSFTAEEAWAMMPAFKGKNDSIFFADFPGHDERGKQSWRDDDLEKRFALIWEARDVALKALEEARQAKRIGHPREARLVLKAPAAIVEALKGTRERLTGLFLVSDLELSAGDALSATVETAPGAKCARCWVYSTKVGTIAADPEICDRCAEAVASLNSGNGNAGNGAKE